MRGGPRSTCTRAPRRAARCAALARQSPTQVIWAEKQACRTGGSSPATTTCREGRPGGIPASATGAASATGIPTIAIGITTASATAHVVGGMTVTAPGAETTAASVATAGTVMAIGTETAGASLPTAATRARVEIIVQEVTSSLGRPGGGRSMAWRGRGTRYPNASLAHCAGPEPRPRNPCRHLVLEDVPSSTTDQEITNVLAYVPGIVPTGLRIPRHRDGSLQVPARATTVACGQRTSWLIRS